MLLVAAFALAAIQNREASLTRAGEPATPGFTPPGSAAPIPAAAPVTPLAALAPSRSLPAVVAAVAAARRHAPIPAGLTPVVSELLNINNPDVEYVFPGGCAPATDAQTTSQVCALGATASRRTIVLFGDSHAQMWLLTILQLAQQDGSVIRPLVKSGCAPYTWVSQYAPAACRAWYHWAVGRAQAIHPAVLLIGGSYGGVQGLSADAEQNGIVDLATAMKRHAQRVVLIADDDAIDRQPVDCLLAPGATMATCTVRRTQADFQLNDDLARAARFDGFAVIATRGWFCYQYECPMVVGQTIVYRDLAHITRTYALDLYAPFRAAFRAAILAR